MSNIAKAQWVNLEDLPDCLVNAVLAIEDHRFYSHKGFVFRRILRALWLNLIHLRTVQGGSTITQQLAKNMFFSFDRSWKRKIREALLTIQMESSYSKDEILEAYLNQVHFTSAGYGVEVAAQQFFGCHAFELNLPQSAVLAGLLAATTRLNPLLNPDEALRRQKLVLLRMHELGMISGDEFYRALRADVQFKKQDGLMTGAYFIDTVERRIQSRFGQESLDYGGLKIYTTCDLEIQKAAERGLIFGLGDLDKRLGLTNYTGASDSLKASYPQGAIVALNPRNGYITALVGGRDFSFSQFNRALRSRRQVGSAFKPFTYLAALENLDVTQASTMTDTVLNYIGRNGENWSPANYDGKYRGRITLRYALVHSINTIAVQLVDSIGPENVIACARRMGIHSPIEPSLSLALGTAEITPLEMATAYSTFANQGLAVKPFIIRRVEGPGGEVLMENYPQPHLVADRRDIYVLNDMLQGVIKEGTGRNLASYGAKHGVAGKTGTTDDYRDSWFIGYTPNFAAAVWVGFDDNRSMITKDGSGVTGATGALPIWGLVYSEIKDVQPLARFPIPPGIVFHDIDPIEGCLAGPNHLNRVKAAFIVGKEPAVRCLDYPETSQQ